MSIDIDINQHAPLTVKREQTRPAGIIRRLSSQRIQPHRIHAPRMSFPVRAFWRMRQFVRGVSAHVNADEMLVVSRILPKAALCRFCQMPLDAQRHSLDVLYTLQRAGYDDPDLSTAALLHDVGKVAGDVAGIALSPWLRGPLVLLDALAPAKMNELASDNPASGWRYLLHVHHSHPAIGAAWAEEDGCSELACWLIANHQIAPHHPATTHRDELHTLLYWADCRN